MNYFAHGVRFIERPYFLAGTAVPDWLSVADRRVRMRARRVAPRAGGSTGVPDEVAAGVLQHLEDDRWFHETRAFHEVTGEMARRFRAILGPEDNFRPGFLGHVATEMLLDAVLIERRPERLDAYYAALDAIDPDEVQRAVNRMARDETHRLAPFIPLFRRAEFLRDYRTTAGIHDRLNQVLRRVRLNPLPDAAAAVLDSGRELARQRCDDLLPAERFGAVLSEKLSTQRR
ncbi:MAG: hypothetical protein WD069_03940 [Planctomycetales bacterium]